MYIESLYLKNFRNYAEEHVSFSHGTNLILGDNGRGKTNLVEAIFLLSTSKSFRRASDQKIRRWGADGYEVRGEFSTEKGRFDISFEYTGEKKNLNINGVQENKISNIIGHIYCVLFSFEDISLVTGPPFLRRNFLDFILSTVDSLYFNNLRTYLRLVRQKNSYLRDTAEIEKDLLDTWNEQLIETGAYIVQKRIFLINSMNRYIEEASERLTQFSAPLKMVYRSNIPWKDEDDTGAALRLSYAEELNRKVNTEIQTGYSLVGPHRDDFLLFDNSSEIRFFGSIGEARLSSIVLKLAKVSFYSRYKAIKPLILIDDIFLELDSKNSEIVLQLFDAENQMIVTTTERTRLPEIFSCDRVFYIPQKGGIECNEIKNPL